MIGPPYGWAVRCSGDSGVDCAAPIGYRVAAGRNGHQWTPQSLLEGVASAFRGRPWDTAAHESATRLRRLASLRDQLGAKTSVLGVSYRSRLF
jgi:hypothetical protein